jgi:RNA polymerase sigma-70 factor, ECF subfamily
MNKEQLLDIIELSKKKEHKAFKKLVEHYQSYAFSLSFKLVCNEEDAKDIVQESFIRVWQHIYKFDIKTKFTTWLYKIVFNLSLDKLKANKRRGHVLADTEFVKVSYDKLLGANPETDFVNKDLASLVASLADDLTPKQRAVFILRDLQGAEMDEISDITSMSKGTVKSNLYYARLSIREKLKRIDNIKTLQHEVR